MSSSPESSIPSESRSITTALVNNQWLDHCLSTASAYKPSGEERSISSSAGAKKASIQADLTAIEKGYSETVLISQIRFSGDHYYKIFRAIVMKEETRPTHQKKQKYRATGKEVTIKGHFLNVYMNDILTVTGSIGRSKIHGTYYDVKTFERIEPGTLTEIKKFLMDRPGIGEKTAEKLVKKHGINTLEYLRNAENPFEGTGIHRKYHEQLREEFDFDNTFGLLLGFLMGFEVNIQYASAIHQQYKAECVNVMKSAPYIPFLEGIVDYATADKLCYLQGVELDDPQYLNMLVLAAIQYSSQSCGHLCVFRHQVPELCQEFLTRSKSAYPTKTIQSVIASEKVEVAIGVLLKRQVLIEDTTTVPGKDYLYLSNNYKDECGIAEELGRISQGMKETFCYPQDVEMVFEQDEIVYQSLTEEQKSAIVQMITKPISILTGGPGTGKTHTINMAISVIQSLFPHCSISLCAPTGKAANRMSEMTGLEAQTIHRFIKLGLYQGRTIPQGYVSADFLIVDEFSMTDASLAHQLFRAMGDSSRIIIIGDVEQLPSVGAGAVLTDLIASQVIATTRLKEVFRQNGDGHIVSNAYTILNHENPYIPLEIETTGKASSVNDFNFIQAEDSDLIIKKIKNCITRLMNTHNRSIHDIQVLSPTRKNNLGTQALNQQLQETFNPDGEIYRGDDMEFRVGDKVIHTVNNYKLDVFNGETGVILQVGDATDRAVYVQYPNNKAVWYSADQLSELELAYAVSVHKSQGSEFPVVIIPINTMMEKMLNKSLIYTAITRARAHVIIIGDFDILSEKSALRTNIRHSSLKERLIAKVKEPEPFRYSPPEILQINQPFAVTQIISK